MLVPPPAGSSVCRHEPRLWVGHAHRVGLLGLLGDYSSELLPAVAAGTVVVEGDTRQAADEGRESREGGTTGFGAVTSCSFLPGAVGRRSRMLRERSATQLPRHPASHRRWSSVDHPENRRRDEPAGIGGSTGGESVVSCDERVSTTELPWSALSGHSMLFVRASSFRSMTPRR